MSAESVDFVALANRLGRSYNTTPEDLLQVATKLKLKYKSINDEVAAGDTETIVRELVAERRTSSGTGSASGLKLDKSALQLKSGAGRSTASATMRTAAENPNLQLDRRDLAGPNVAKLANARRTALRKATLGTTALRSTRERVAPTSARPPSSRETLHRLVEHEVERENERKRQREEAESLRTAQRDAQEKEDQRRTLLREAEEARRREEEAKAAEIREREERRLGERLRQEQDAASRAPKTKDDRLTGARPSERGRDFAGRQGRDGDMRRGPRTSRRDGFYQETGRGGRRTARRPDVDQGGTFEKPVEFIQRDVEVGETIQIGELAQMMSVKAGDVIKKLLEMDVMATVNTVVDQDTAMLIIEEFGHNAIASKKETLAEKLQESLDVEGEAITRPPVVTVMGHVDHGKTSLLDYIRKANVVSGEAGGITQHIGAYHLQTEHGPITFLDTPGHAAFSAMRARGANATDIVVLVCAADDGVMPQTEEAVRHAQAAEVSIIVAVNKMDLPGANPERVRSGLSALGIQPEDWGGTTQFIHCSAETGEGVDQLLESISLEAELLELSAVVDAPARGVVIESKVERGRGSVASLLVQNGTLKQGDVVVAGEHFGKVRAINNDLGKKVKSAGPAIPVELLGLNGSPSAGDSFSVALEERQARQVAAERAEEQQARLQAQQQAAKIENIFSGLGKGERSVLKVIFKADVRGSLEAIVQACADLGNEEVSVQVLGSGVGGITESDVNLALTYGGVIFGFNVRTDKSAKELTQKNNIEVRYYNIIYELIDDIKSMLTDLLVPEQREEIIGMAEVRDVFRSPRYGQIAGCMVVDGTVFRNQKIRVLRNSTVIYEGELESLRRFKDDVEEVRNGFECGIGVRNYDDVQMGDLIEVFQTREVARQL